MQLTFPQRWYLFPKNELWPNLNFTGLKRDRVLILHRVLESRMYALIGNRDYPTKKPYIFEEYNSALLNNIEINKLLFVRGPFTHYPICMSQLKGGQYAGYYAVDQRSGGPLLELSLPSAKKEGRTIKLVPGDVSYYAYYWKPDGSETYRVPDDVKAHFKNIVKIIKPALVRFDIGKQVWIGKDALHILENGAATILSNGKWLSFEDIMRPRNRV